MHLDPKDQTSLVATAERPSSPSLPATSDDVLAALVIVHRLKKATGLDDAQTLIIAAEKLLGEAAKLLFAHEAEQRDHADPQK